jgi:hypothetical protein
MERRVAARKRVLKRGIIELRESAHIGSKCDRSDRRNTCSGVKARKRKGSLKQILTREKLGLQIFGPCLGARETGGLSMYPRGVKFRWPRPEDPTRL